MTWQAIASKSMSELTHEDFEIIRRENPAAAAELSNRYDRWWSARTTTPAVVPVPPAATTAKALYTDAEKSAFRGLLKSIADKSHKGDPLSELDAILGTCGSMTPTPAAAARIVTIYLTTAIEQQREHNKKLEARIKELEQRPPSGIAYRGVWRAGETYQRGDFVTWGNSMWHAWGTTDGKPGDSRDWQLAVRRGGDGRDGKCICTVDK